MTTTAQTGAQSMHAKWISWLVAFTASVAVEIPHGFKIALWCFFWAFMADNVTGVWAAGASGSLRSQINRTKMAPKLAAYFGIMVSFGVLGLVLGSSWVPCWPVVIAGVAWCTANEVQSNLENIIKIQITCGVNLGKLGDALRVLAAWFGIPEHPRMGETVSSTATLIPADSTQPIIQTTSVERLPGKPSP